MSAGPPSPPAAPDTPADPNADAQLGSRPQRPDRTAAERDEAQTERQAPEDAGPGEAAGG